MYLNERVVLEKVPDSIPSPPSSQTLKLDVAAGTSDNPEHESPIMSGEYLKDEKPIEEPSRIEEGKAPDDKS